MIKMFQAKQIRTVNTYDSRKKKITAKKGMLSPQAVPLLLQDADILLVIKGAHNRRQHRKNQKASHTGL